jgi:ribosomal protein S18 acetylase RimI-like enzyme
VVTSDPSLRRSVPPVEVRALTRDDVPEVVKMLARTFDDDPVTNYIFPSARRRAPGLRMYFRLQIVNDFLAHGGVLTTADHTGAAVWGPPGKPMQTGVRGLLGVLPVAPYVIGNLSRTLRELARIQSLHPKEPHWYLATLGTHVDHQGKGIGSAVMQPILDRCDAEGIPAYLESSKERNVPFYRRHGFEVTHEIKGDDIPTIWTMWREPRPPSPA